MDWPQWIMVGLLVIGCGLSIHNDAPRHGPVINIGISLFMFAAAIGQRLTYKELVA